MHPVERANEYSKISPLLMRLVLDGFEGYSDKVVHVVQLYEGVLIKDGSKL